MGVAILNFFLSKVIELCNFNVEIKTWNTNGLFGNYERFARGRSGHREIKTNIKTDDFSAISTPLGYPWGSTDPEEPMEFNFLGFKCNHQGLK